MTIPINLPSSLVEALNCSAPLTGVEAELVETLDGGRAALPVLPTVASRALDLANDPSSSVGQFAALVKTDPPIAARFLATANSSFYNRGHAIRSVEDAVARIGLAGSRDLIFQVVYAATATGLSRFQSAVQASFRRSVLCGVLCRVSAPILSVDLKDAYLCGLLHDIGESRVLRILSETKTKCSAADATELVSKYHDRAGGELAMRWALPDPVIQVCRKHHEAGKPASPQLLLVRLADALAPVIEAEQEGREPPDPALLRDAIELLEIPGDQAAEVLGRGKVAAARL